MFRKMYDSLSMDVHLELLIKGDLICLKSWQPISQEDYENDTSQLEREMFWAGERSLNSAYLADYMQWPADVSGVFHTRMPSMKMAGSNKIMGEEFLPNIPAEIRDAYAARLSGKYFQAVSYSWIDPSDPSIGTGELDDGACWTIGVDHLRAVSPAQNTIAYSRNAKTHPLREARRWKAPVSLMLYVPFKDMAFTDCSMTLKYNRGYGFSTNILDGWTVGANDAEIFENSAFNYTGHINDAMPSFVVTSGGGSIDAGGSDTVEFKMVDENGDTINRNTVIYLEHTGGYLPHQRVTLNNGVGTFDVHALHMTSGDTFKVKIGFRSYVGMTDVDYTVA